MLQRVRYKTLREFLAQSFILNEEPEAGVNEARCLRVPTLWGPIPEDQNRGPLLLLLLLFSLLRGLGTVVTP